MQNQILIFLIFSLILYQSFPFIQTIVPLSPPLWTPFANTLIPTLTSVYVLMFVFPLLPFLFLSPLSSFLPFPSSSSPLRFLLSLLSPSTPSPLSLASPLLPPSPFFFPSSLFFPFPPPLLSIHPFPLSLFPCFVLLF